MPSLNSWLFAAKVVRETLIRTQNRARVGLLSATQYSLRQSARTFDCYPPHIQYSPTLHRSQSKTAPTVTGRGGRFAATHAGPLSSHSSAASPAQHRAQHLTSPRLRPEVQPEGPPHTAGQQHGQADDRHASRAFRRN